MTAKIFKFLCLTLPILCTAGCSASAAPVPDVARMHKKTQAITITLTAESHLWRLDTDNPEVKFEFLNSSDRVIHITWATYIFGKMQMHIQNEQGQVLETFPFGTRVSCPGPTEYTLIQPGEKRCGTMSYVLGEVVNKNELVTGKYTLKATYKYEDVVYESNSIKVSIIEKSR